MALLADTVCGRPCNFTIAFIRSDVLSLTFTVCFQISLLREINTLNCVTHSLRLKLAKTAKFS